MTTGSRRSPIRILYRIHRRTKQFVLERRPPLLTPLFFHAERLAIWLLSPRRRGSPDQAAESAAWAARYRSTYGDQSPFRVETTAPVAVSSDDHVHPRGTSTDNSRNAAFNHALYARFPAGTRLRVMDLGCSGGGFVRSILEDGHEALGLEGSDYSLRTKAAEWGTIPRHLFTCDITAPFRVRDAAGEPVRFHCVTAWEVLEHLPAELVPGFALNVREHLRPDGIFVASVATFRDEDPLTGAIYHLTLQPREWWLDRFAEAGLEPHPQAEFRTEEYVRGNGVGVFNWDPADGDGFHLVLRPASHS